MQVNFCIATLCIEIDERNQSKGTESIATQEDCTKKDRNGEIAEVGPSWLLKTGPTLPILPPAIVPLPGT